MIKEPVGPVAAFTPWNFPINQVVRKLSAALAAGCSIIVKAPEETPASPAELIRAFADAGVPAGVINLVYGVPAEISEYLIPHPMIRKISFTGSTAVGKQLAALAGAHMKRVTMELGGHAPAIVFDDADVDVGEQAAGRRASSATPARSASRRPASWCRRRSTSSSSTASSPHAKALKVGDGLEAGTHDGAAGQCRAASPRWRRFIGDAAQKGATVRTGGSRIGNKGNFFEPTVLTDVPLEARVMNEEPFGPLAVISPFRGFDDVVAEANRLPFGLASYAYTRSAKTANAIAAAVEAGMMSINHHGPGAARGAVRRRQGFRLRLRRRVGGDRGLSEHQVRHPGRHVKSRGGRVLSSRPALRVRRRCRIAFVPVPPAAFAHSIPQPTIVPAPDRPKAGFALSFQVQRPSRR